MTRSSDFGGLLRTIGADKRTVRLIAESETIQMRIDFVDGRVVRADRIYEGDLWPLGELLVHLGFIRTRHIRRLIRRAGKKNVQPEEVVLARELISIALLKRFRERLTLQNLCDLGRQNTFRAELKKTDADLLKAQDWDVEIPIPFVLNTMDTRSEERALWSGELPPGEARYEQRQEALQKMLEGGVKKDLEWSPEVRRIFFLCNGRTPFSTYPMIVGQSREKVASIVQEFLDRGLVDRSIHSISSLDLKERLGGLLRVLSSFSVGVISVALIAFFFVQLSTWVQGDLEALPPLGDQKAHKQSRGAALAEVRDALEFYKRVEDRYPESLTRLHEKTGLRMRLFNDQDHGGRLEYLVVPSGLKYQLQVVHDVEWKESEKLE